MEGEEEVDHLLLSETDCVVIAIHGDRDEPKAKGVSGDPKCGSWRESQGVLREDRLLLT